MSKKVCFIGHRRVGGIREKLKEAVLCEIAEGCHFFTMGTHGDFDQMALSVCREVRKEFDIQIEVVITSINIFKKGIYSDVKTVMYNIEDTHFKRQIIESNYQMIGACDTLICYVDENKSVSGARYAYQYAKKKGLRIVNLYKND